MYSKIIELEQRISEFPKGCISTKTINGKIRHYLQWSENGKTKSKYLKDDDYEITKELIEDRKRLEKLLLSLKKENGYPIRLYQMQNKIILGQELSDFIANAARLTPKPQAEQTYDYLTGFSFNDICYIKGNQGSGKTILLIHTAGKLSKEELQHCAYILPEKNSCYADLKKDLTKLSKAKFTYILIDNIQNIHDFKEYASELTDYYIPKGMKIIITGNNIDKTMEDLDRNEYFLKLNTVEL